ncbi:MAG: bifunctional heptose 7-phosphate kinase/heptose 1-phosphate adenyltransferase [Planctomycetota bacterium]
MMQRERLHELLSSFPSRRVAVMGDFCLDVYWHAEMTRARLSRETPRFPLPVVRETFSAGGAANVAWNVAELGVGTVEAIALFGDDWRGRELRRLLDERHGVDLHRVVTAPDRVTPAYAKPIRHGFHSEQEDSRLDFINVAPAPPALEDQVLAGLADSLPGLDALIVADQLDGGLLSPRVRERLLALAADHPDVVVLVDSRQHIGAFPGVHLKPNELEAARAVHPHIAPGDITDDVLRDCGRRLAALAGKPVFLTIGERGILVFDGDRCHPVPGYPQEPPLDIVGAGDTCIAALAAALAAGASPAEAADLACLAASVTVRKLGITGAASPAELRTRLDDTA